MRLRACLVYLPSLGLSHTRVLLILRHFPSYTDSLSHSKLYTFAEDRREWRLLMNTREFLMSPLYLC